jgi:hypothetical protein
MISTWQIESCIRTGSRHGDQNKGTKYLICCTRQRLRFLRPTKVSGPCKEGEGVVLSAGVIVLCIAWQRYFEIAENYSIRRDDERVGGYHTKYNLQSGFLREKIQVKHGQHVKIGTIAQHGRRYPIFTLLKARSDGIP